jgi:hypothetical protein
MLHNRRYAEESKRGNDENEDLSAWQRKSSGSYLAIDR